MAKAPRIIIQGIEYSNSDIALTKYLEDREITRFSKIFTETPQEFTEQFHDMKNRDKRFYTFAPFLNNIGGFVDFTKPILPEKNIIILGEQFQYIKHKIASREETNLEKLAGMKILSHPQALAQCSDYIENNGLEAVISGDTSLAAREAREGELVICSEESANKYNLNILDTDPSNRISMTRFLMIGVNSPRNPYFVETGAPTKKRVIIESKVPKQDESMVLENLKRLGLRLTHSYESYKPGKNMFDTTSIFDLIYRIDDNGFINYSHQMHRDDVKTGIPESVMIEQIKGMAKVQVRGCFEQHQFNSNGETYRCDQRKPIIDILNNTIDIDAYNKFIGFLGKNELRKPIVYN